MKNLKIFTPVLAALLAVGSLSAKPAMRGIRTIEQPDGTSLRIKVIGDENLHFTTTEDGLLLKMDDDGFYRIAILGDTGNIVSTGVSAMSPTASAVGVNIKDIDFSEIRKKRIGKSRKAPQSGLGMASTTFPTMGSPKALVILVQYADVFFRSTDSYDAKDYFNDMINGEDFKQFKGTGSALKYFKDQSDGKFAPQFDVYGPVTLPQKQSYYGKNDAYGDDQNPHLMVTDAIQILDPDVDFSQYDTDGDGVIDNVYVFYAGQGESDYGTPNTVWPHSWDVRYGGVNMTVDGVTVGHYACSNEWGRSTPDGIGTFVHEFSHVMGLPDLYHTTDPNSYYTPLDYSVLDYGPYNNNGRTPPNYGAYEKNALGWFEPAVLEGPASVVLESIDNHGFCLIPTEKDTEFFLLENRQQTGWDTYIPNHGMLIWHIDYVESVFANNTVNNRQTHQYVDIVEANNNPGGSTTSLRGYTFPGTSNNTSFTSTTTPALRSWSGKAIDLPITNITEAEGLIKFNVAGGGEELVADVDMTPAEDNDKTEYYNLQGIKVENPSKGMILIERNGDKVRKVIF